MSHEPPEHTQAELRALAHIRSLDAVRAPVALRASIEELASGAHLSRRRLRVPRLRLAAAGALAAAILALVAIVLGAGSSPTANRGAPTVLEAARVALLPATLGAPAERSGQSGLLKRSVEGVAYPYWGGRLGWQATGARTDRLGAHTITTVFYTDGSGRRVGYAIVAGTALPAPSAGAVVQRGAVRFRVLGSDGLAVLTWREAGHTCILAGRGVAPATLLRLAGWRRV
jgi:hypothetical protein